MKILHVIHSLDLRSGGPSHAIRQMCRAQADAGIEVSLLATNVQSSEPWAPRDEYVEKLRNDGSFEGIEVVVHDAYGRKGPWHRYAYSPNSRRWLLHRLRDRRLRPDVVHIHGVFSHVTASAASVARANRIPYIVRPTGALDPGCYESGSRWLKRAFTKLLLQRDLRDAAFIHATSEAEALSMRRWVSSDQIRIVPLGVEVPQFDRTTAAESLLRKLPVLRGRRIVLFVARVAPIKRAELLVEAMAQLHNMMPDVALLIVGQDSGGMHAVQEAVARHALHESVIMPGFLQGADKQAAFAAAEVFALASSHENFGIAVVEAMAHGLPVLVTPGVASHVFVDASGCGHTVEGTAESIATGLREILAGDHRRMGRRGREYVAEHLAWPAIIRQLDTLYRECCTGFAVEKIPNTAV
jgi:glycosyltransferase involved in cell wall biosynthesis